jgi:hypothetical protein
MLMFEFSFSHFYGFCSPPGAEAVLRNGTLFAYAFRERNAQRVTLFHYSLLTTQYPIPRKERNAQRVTSDIGIENEKNLRLIFMPRCKSVKWICTGFCFINHEEKLTL